MNRRILAGLLLLAMVISLLPTVSLAADPAPETMWILPTQENGLPTQIKLCTPFVATSSGGGGGWNWGNWGGGGGSTTPTEPVEEDTYQVYLPGNANPEACFLTWEGDAVASVGEAVYKSGELPIPSPGQTVNVTFGEEKLFKISSYQGSVGVAPMFIDIDESLGTIKAMNADREHETTCTGVVYVDGTVYELPKMKGRGNYSWTSSKQKRPYNITLGEKVKLLGIDTPKIKKYSLLANVTDHTMLRNKLAYDLAYDMGIGLDSAFCDLWLNGEYQGTYLVTPKTDSYITDDGYLIENDNYREDSVESGGDPSFTVKGKSASDTTYKTGGLLTTIKKIGTNLLPGGEETPEAITEAAEPIKAYLQEAWDAAGSKDGVNAQGKYYADYFDLPSTAAMYLLHEFIKNLEVEGGSIFFHRDGTGEGDKLIAGPAWDYDNALGFHGTSFGSNNNYTNIDGWYLPNRSNGMLFTTLGRHEDLMAEVRRIYNAYHRSFDGVCESLLELADLIEDSANMNFVCDIGDKSMNSFDYSSESTKGAGTEYEVTYKVTDTWRDYIDNLYTYTSGRARFLRDELLDAQEPTYEVSFASDDCDIYTYDTQDVSGTGTKTKLAVARSSETGQTDVTGDGQVNFRVDAPEGTQYTVRVEPAENYKNLKGPADTGAENCYRITKITGPLTVTVEAVNTECDHIFENGVCKKCGLEAYCVSFDCDEHCTVRVYDTQDLTAEGRPASVAYARSSTGGEIDTTGDGQVNFVLVPEPGYGVERVTAEPKNYKNLKDPADTLTPNAYRLTKITGDVTVTVRTAKIDCTHEYQAVTVAPTCTEGGYTEYTCSCGSTYRDSETKALGHSWDNGTVTRAATEEKAGEKLYTCTRCKNTKTEEIPALDHTHKYTKTVIAPTCTDGGYTEYTCSCGSTYRDSETKALGHSWDNGTVTRAATEEKAGEKLYTCTRCKNTKTEEIPALDHTHKYTKTVIAPTCTDGGYTEYTCSCGSTYRDSETKALGHSWDNGTVTRAATEEKAGEKLYTCTRCKNTKTEEIPALDHTHKYTKTVIAPTCTDGGYTEYTCSCGSTYRDSELDALGHSYENGVCIRCGAPHEDICPGRAFTDMPSYGNWAHNGIDYCIEKELMNGISATEFQPNGNVTRAQLVTILYRVEGSPKVEAPADFTDVPTGKWYSDAIAWAAANGIVNGTAPGKFDPNANITREQIAAILYRYAGSPKVEGTLDEFPDASAVHSYAKNAMIWAVQNNLINGIKSGDVTNLAPGSNATRAQIASIIMRYLESK